MIKSQLYLVKNDQTLTGDVNQFSDDVNDAINNFNMNRILKEALKADCE